ncbi:MAG: cohesin domain-containing protein [Patescibacteria group bacterium]
MKKILFTLTVVGAIVLATPALAATTVSLSSVSVSVEEGQTFNLTVSVNSQVVKSYMVKLEIKYPADVLEVGSFNFGNNWMQLSQPGYDLIDNTNGILIKTAGYPGGLISQADFGTIVFKVKKSGAGVIQVTENSLALNADNLNVISGLPVGASVTITQVISPTPETQIQPKTTIKPIIEVNIVPILPVTQEQTAQPVVVPQTATKNPLIAALGVIITLGTGSVWLGILVGLIILAGLIYLAYWLRTRKSSGNIK